MESYAEISVIDAKKIIKFYNYPYDPPIRPNSLGNLLENPKACKKLVQLSKDWETHSVTDEEKKEFVENKFILGEYEIINPKNNNLIRCFIRIDLVKPTPELAKLFEKQVIKKYLSTLDTVKSIYQTSGTPGFKCDYLIDVIDKPHSVFDIILELHSKSDALNVNINSNTFVVVEQLSSGMFNKLPIKEEDDVPIQEIIKEGEGEFIEFKSSLRWDTRENRVNKDLELKIVKTISAFMNSNGGCLLIGIDDTGNIIGLDSDFLTLKKKDKDGFELQITTLITAPT